MRIAVLSAGLSSPSTSRVLADQLATAAKDRLGPDTRLDVVELRGLGHALVDNLLTGFPSPELASAIETVTTADGLIAVTPTFSASYSALFKAFFDVVDREALTGMPVLIGATGGTERHSLVLDFAVRPLLSYLHASVIPTGVYAASTDFGARGGDTAGLARRIDRAAAEFTAAVQTRAGAPATISAAGTGSGDPQVPVPFEQLLASLGQVAAEGR